MEPRHAKTYERTIPANGDHGGPLCCIVAKYEDGTQISFGHEVMNKYVPADLADALAVAAEEAKQQIEYLHGKFQETGTGNAVIARLQSALAALKAMEG